MAPSRVSLQRLLQAGSKKDVDILAPESLVHERRVDQLRKAGLNGSSVRRVKDFQDMLLAISPSCIAIRVNIQPGKGKDWVLFLCVLVFLARVVHI
jgi:hypothetical protein